MTPTFWADRRQLLPNRFTSELPVLGPNMKTGPCHLSALGARHSTHSRRDYFLVS
jgi:hypothetical protein